LRLNARLGASLRGLGVGGHGGEHGAGAQPLGRVRLVVHAEVHQGRLAGAEGPEGGNEPGGQAVGIDGHAQGQALGGVVQGAECGHGAVQLPLEHVDLLHVAA
jgi:hypothetical protein